MTTRRYQTRPGRLAVVVADLGDLTGPVTGVVTLPNRLCWQPCPSFDLTDRWELRHMYEIVLREAIAVRELTTWLDRELLRDLWDELYLPRGVRQAWEDRHPALCRAVAAA